MKTKIRTRTATRAESLQWLNSSIPKSDRDAMELKDGKRDACRLILNRETGEPMVNEDGSLQYCAPWLLCGIF